MDRDANSSVNDRQSVRYPAGGSGPKCQTGVSCSKSEARQSQQKLVILAKLSLPAAICMLGLLGAAGCATYEPVPLDQLDFRDRTVSEEKDGLRVSVAVLSRAEARQAFGVNLQERHIQPVWIEIENNTDEAFWFMLHGLDPNYFSANEAAYMNHYFLGGDTNKQMDAYFASLGIDQAIPPGRINSGFAFSNETVGTKEVRVRLFSNRDVRTFEFYASVPGVESEWDKRDLRTLYTDEQLIHVTTHEELREAVESLPCCIQWQDGSGEGMPINLVIVGGRSALRAFLKSGWDEQFDQTTLSSVFGPTYLYGRRPDLIFEKQRRRVNSRTTVAIWLTPIRFNGTIVSAATVGRSIDPDIDEAVEYVVQDLATARTVKRYGIVRGVDAVGRDDPRRAFLDTTYWTSGERFVLETTAEETALDEVETFDWTWANSLGDVERAGADE